MKTISVLFLSSVALSIAHSTSFSNEEIILHHFLSTLSNEVLAAQQEASLQQEMASPLPLPLTLDSLSTYSKEKASQNVRGRLLAQSQAGLYTMKAQKNFRKLGQDFDITKVPKVGNRHEYMQDVRAHSEKYNTTPPDLQYYGQLVKEKLSKMLMCMLKRIPDYVELLKGHSNIDQGLYRPAEKFQELKEVNVFSKFLKSFLNAVRDFLPNSKTSSRVVVNQQDISLKFLSETLKNTFESFANATPIGLNSKDEDFRNLLNIASAFLNKRWSTAFNHSLNYGLDKVFNRVGLTEERKKSIRNAVNFVIFALKNGIKSNPEKQNHSLRKIIIALTAFNVGMTSEASLFNTVDKILSKNLTVEELRTKAYCLIAMGIRNGLKHVFALYAKEVLDQYDPIGCAVDTIKEFFNLILSYIPEQVSTVGGCEDFGKSSGRTKAKATSRAKVKHSVSFLGS